MSNTSQPLWQGAELSALFQQRTKVSAVNGISIDSRSIIEGDMFIALAGDPGPPFNGGEPMVGARDGHEYISAAIAAGASVVMRHDDHAGDETNLRVDNTLSALWQLGAAAAERIPGKTVAITGSSGKTTLRSWFETVLVGQGNIHASTGSLNNHWGVPVSLARMPVDTDFGVFEVGTNHPGEIAPLSKLVQPDVALLLNVLPAHIGNFPDMAALRAEKLSIAAGLNEEGVLVLPVSLLPALQASGLQGRNRVLTFADAANASEADISADVEQNAAGMHMRVRVAGLEIPCNVPFNGQERAESVLALLGVCHALGISLPKVASNLERLVLPTGRGNRQQIADVTVIDDSYNANPASMLMALRDLSATAATGKKYALLGEMLELGDASHAAHAEVAAATRGCDEVLSFGAGFDSAEFEVEHHHYAATSALDLNAFVQRLSPGDVILVKGSNRVFWVNQFVRQLCGALET